MTKSDKADLANLVHGAAAKGWTPKEISQFHNLPVSQVEAILRPRTLLMKSVSRVCKPKALPRLGKKALEIFAHLVRSVNERGFAPSIREIGEAVGLHSSSTVHRHLSNLQAHGKIWRDPFKSRVIVVLDGSTSRIGTAADLIRDLAAVCTCPDLRERARVFLREA